MQGFLDTSTTVKQHLFSRIPLVLLAHSKHFLHQYESRLQPTPDKPTGHTSMHICTLCFAHTCVYYILCNIYIQTQILICSTMKLRVKNHVKRNVSRMVPSFEDLCRDRLADQQVATINSGHVKTNVGRSLLKQL